MKIPADPRAYTGCDPRASSWTQGRDTGYPLHGQDMTEEEQTFFDAQVELQEHEDVPLTEEDRREIYYGPENYGRLTDDDRERLEQGLGREL